MKGLALTNIFITALIAAIIGIAVVLPIVWQSVSDSTTVYGIVNESTLRVYNATNLTSFILLHPANILINDTNHPYAVYRVRDSTDALTKDVNYILSKNGTVRILNVSSDWNNTLLNYPKSWQVGVDYTYTGNDYMDNPVQRTLIKQLPVLVALILVIAFAGYLTMMVA